VIRGRIRTADGAVLAIQQTGPADGPPLLLLPGQSNSHRWWDHLRGGFDDVCRTITFDYRGTGGTTALEEPWSTTSFAADAATVLDALGLRGAHVYGTSMGGRVAQMLAINHPTTVGRLVLACTSPGGPDAQERSTAIRRQLARPDDDIRTASIMRLMYTPEWTGRAADSTLLGDPTMTARAAALHLRISNEHDASRDLHRIVAPTLVLHGVDDELSPPANASVIAAGIPGATAEIVPGRHGFFDEFSAAVTPRVRAHLGV